MSGNEGEVDMEYAGEFDAPPENSDVYEFIEPIDDMEFTLPENDDFPADELQGRLEMPTTVIYTTDADGSNVVLQTDSTTEPGIEPRWSETDEMTRTDEGSNLGTVSLTGGQLQVNADPDKDGRG